MKNTTYGRIFIGALIVIIPIMIVKSMESSYFSPEDPSRRLDVFDAWINLSICANLMYFFFSMWVKNLYEKIMSISMVCNIYTKIIEEIALSVIIVLSISVFWMIYLSIIGGIYFHVDVLVYGYLPLIIFLLSFFLGAISEELTFREILPNVLFLQKRDGFFSIVMVSCLFSIIHINVTTGEHIYLFVFAIVLALLRRKYGNISVPIGIHFSSNISYYLGLTHNIGENYFNIVKENMEHMVNFPVALLAGGVFLVMPKKFLKYDLLDGLRKRHRIRAIDNQMP